ncbi:MAG: hypothetical protein ACR2PJ_02060 [Pseudomonadales bacterium]
MKADMQTLLTLLNEDPELARRGKFYSTSFSIQEGDEATNFIIEDGKVAAINSQPNEQVAFKFVGSKEIWNRFREAEPPPGYHDLSAAIDQGHLSLEGDPVPWLYNTLYIKRLVSLWKEAAITPSQKWRKQ